MTEDSLKCMACGCLYHYQCLGMTKAQFKSNQHINLKRSWRCPSCANITRRKGDNTPVGKSQVTPVQLNDTIMSCDESSFVDTDVLSRIEDGRDRSAVDSRTSASVSNQVTITYAQFGELLDQKLKHIKDSLTHELKAAVRSEINCAMEKYKAEINHSIEFLADDQRDLKVAIDAAHAQIKLIEVEKSNLQTSFQNLERRLSVIERTSRSKNLELHSVPEKRSENLLALLKNLGERLKVNIPDTSGARRISKFNNSNDRPRNILVSLPSERHRDIIIAAYKKYNKTNAGSPLNSSDLGVPGEPFRVYVVEHLAPECKELYAAARKAAKEQHYRFIWVKYGRIYVRKEENSAPIHIKDRESLSNLR